MNTNLLGQTATKEPKTGSPDFPRSNIKLTMINYFLVMRENVEIESATIRDGGHPGADKLTVQVISTKLNGFKFLEN